MLILSMAQEWACNSCVSSGLLDTHTTASAVVTIALTLGFGIPESPLVAAMMRVAASGAAADAEKPEECGSPREDDAEPCDVERVCAENDVDVIVVEYTFQGADHRAEQSCAHSYCG